VCVCVKGFAVVVCDDSSVGYCNFAFLLLVKFSLHRAAWLDNIVLLQPVAVPRQGTNCMLVTCRSIYSQLPVTGALSFPLHS